ncbi:MAG TPA: tetratricopeptide repeat protein [Anaerolineales bacterium]|nr:tetratricopeptide repeat protein [Anaerolineales bacterium]
MQKPFFLKDLARQCGIIVLLLVLSLAPRPILGYLDLKHARALVAGNPDYRDLADSYASAAERLPWEPSLYEEAANAYLKAGDFAGAEEFYRLGLQHGTLSPDSWMGWEQAVAAQGDLPAAIAIWEQALDRKGLSPYLHWDLARAYQAVGNYPGAIRQWQAFLAAYPGDGLAHYQLGLLLAATDPENALPELMQASRLEASLDPTVQGLRSALNASLLSGGRADHFVVAGRSLAALGDWDLAGEAFRNATVANAGDAEAWAWLAETRQQLGQDGKIEIEKALALNPDLAIVQSMYGLYLQRQDRPAAALRAFQIAASLDPGNAAWQLALAGGFEQTGNLVAALDHYQQAVLLAPDDPSAWRALAQFSLRKGVDLAGTGLPAALRLMELSNSDWQSFDIAGQLLMETGDPVGAEDLLKRALALDPTRAAPALHLGLLYLQTGNRAGAYSYLNQARIFDPSGPDGWQAGRLLDQYFP